MTKKIQAQASLFAFALFSSTPSLGEEQLAPASTAESASRNLEFDVAGSYSVSPLDRRSRKPGLGLFLGYKLSPWSTLGLKYDTRAHGAGGFHDEYEELTLSYKYWIALGRWSPYLQAGAGYARMHSSIIGNVSGVTTESTFSSHGNLALQLGGGYRYSFTQDVGLDLGLHYHSLGSPWSWHDKFLVSKIGLDVSF